MNREWARQAVEAVWRASPVLGKMESSMREATRAALLTVLLCLRPPDQRLLRWRLLERASLKSIGRRERLDFSTISKRLLRLRAWVLGVMRTNLLTALPVAHAADVAAAVDDALRRALRPVRRKMCAEPGCGKVAYQCVHGRRRYAAAAAARRGPTRPHERVIWAGDRLLLKNTMPRGWFHRADTTRRQKLTCYLAPSALEALKLLALVQGVPVGAVIERGMAKHLAAVRSRRSKILAAAQMREAKGAGGRR